MHLECRILIDNQTGSEASIMQEHSNCDCVHIGSYTPKIPDGQIAEIPVRIDVPAQQPEGPFKNEVYLVLRFPGQELPIQKIYQVKFDQPVLKNGNVSSEMPSAILIPKVDFLLFYASTCESCTSNKKQIERIISSEGIPEERCMVLDTSLKKIFRYCLRMANRIHFKQSFLSVPSAEIDIRLQPHQGHSGKSE